MVSRTLLQEKEKVYDELNNRLERIIRRIQSYLIAAEKLLEETKEIKREVQDKLLECRNKLRR